MVEFVKYHIQRGLIVKVPSDMLNEFGEGDCYLVDTQSIIYLWCGNKATPDERFIGAVTSVWRDQARKGAARLVSIDQGRETPEFLELFGGNIRVTNLLMLDRELAETIKQTYEAMNDRKAEEKRIRGRYDKTPDIIRYYSEEEKNKFLSDWEDFVATINGRLERSNAVTDLIDVLPDPVNSST